jgi:hypothetical protein
MCVLLRARLAARPRFASFVLLLVVTPTSAFAVERVPAKNDILAATLGEALQREIYGLNGDRQRLLSEVSALAPDFAPARWHLGYVKDPDRGWLRHDQWQVVPKMAARLAAYERRRDAAEDTVKGQLALADWCQKEGLLQQERAHLTRVIDLDANHAFARARLGFVRDGNDWISPAEIALDRAREAARQAALAKWGPVLREIRQDLEHRSAARRAKAQERLTAITEPGAAEAIEFVFADAKEELILLGLERLAGMQDPAASQVLCRFAVLAPSLAVRQAAAKRLAGLPQEQYVPQLLDSLYSPVKTQFAAMRLPNGRIGYRHAFAREGQSQHQVMLLDTEYKRIAYVGGSAARTASQAIGDAAEKALDLEAAVAEQNRQTTALNDRLIWVLKTATGVDLPAQPESWWTWWNEVNEVFVPGTKPIAWLHDVQRVEVEDEVPEYLFDTEEPSDEPEDTASDSGGGIESQPARRRVSLRRVPLVRQDCLAAGTLVWTAKGPLEIETIRVGDLVLSQHPETGELAYKPVLRTTTRPPGQLVTIQAGGETCQTSGGHLFWVAGEGWVRSRELESGQILHGASGPVHITSVSAGPEAETYNLIVADFNTYFVGYRKVLSHDNTVRQPTRALVPGLSPH